MKEQTETALLQSIDDAIISAGHIMDLDDVTETEDLDYDATYEARYHCGVCTVTTVMETVWPSINEYIKFLKQGHSSGAANVLASRVLEFLVDPSEHALQNMREAINLYLQDQQ